MMRQTRKRRDADNERALTQATALSAARIDAVQQEIEAIPPAPAVSVAQMWRSIARWPTLLRLRAIKILVNKLAADFAFRSLLFVEKITTNEQHVASGNDDMLRLNPNDPEDQQALRELLDLWAHLPGHTHVDNDRDFERFARITAGLQIMMEAAPLQAADSWAFDSGPEYSRMLSQAQLLPAATVTAQAFIGAGDKPTIQVKTSHIDRTGATIVETGVLPWPVPGANTVSIPPSHMTIDAQPSIMGYTLASA